MKAESESKKSAWLERYSQGILAIESGAIADAIELLNESIAIAQQSRLREEFAHSMLSLGSAYKLSGDFNKAKETYDRVYEYASGNSELTAFTALAQGALGIAYLEHNDVEHALVELEAAVRIVHRKHVQRKPEFAPMIMALAGVHIRSREFKKADKLCRYALDIAKEVLGTEDACTIAIMTELVLSAENLGKPKRVELLKRQLNEVTGKLGGVFTDQLHLSGVLQDATQTQSLAEQMSRIAFSH